MFIGHIDLHIAQNNSKQNEASNFTNFTIKNNTMYDRTLTHSFLTKDVTQTQLM